MIYYPEGVNDTLCRNFESIKDVKEAMHKGEIIESRALLCDKEHNLHVDLGAVRGIIPYCEGALGIQEGTVRDIALISKVNKKVCFKIIGFHRDEYNNMVAVLSRRMVQLECIRDYIGKLSLGDVVEARVTHLEKFGVFIDIGCGINSLIPIDMLSVSRITHPNERVYEGQLIRCVLRKKEEGKLTFSLKELLGTWQENADLYSVGETVTGVVRSIESYGVFIELMPNLAGLAEPCDELRIGQSVSVFIKSIMSERMKIKLVVVEAFDDIAPVPEIVYFDNREHIDVWNYSPINSSKIVETRFE
jgi:small subunit ribosomal protein S1